MKTVWLWSFLACWFPAVLGASQNSDDFSGPAALVAGPTEETVFLACPGAQAVLEISLLDGSVLRPLQTPSSPSGLAISPKRDRLLVSCAGPESQLWLFDVVSGRKIIAAPAGHTALSPLFSPSGKRAYLCSRFDNCVREFDLDTGTETAVIPVLREPVSAALTPDASTLLVANHLHSGRSDTNVVAASVSVIDTALRQIKRHLQLPNGSTMLRDVAISPDGKYAAVVHNLARFHLPTTHVTWGWMNNAALTLIDVERVETLNTVLLDDLTAGAANPWACVWSPNGSRLLITHAGTHELTVIDAQGLIQKLLALPVMPNAPVASPEYFPRARVRSDVPNDFRFLQGLKKRIPLAGRGPRSLALVKGVPIIASYFSDSIERVSIDEERPTTDVLWSRSPSMVSAERRGHDLFNDARLCLESWQSCASCHSDDARVDGLNWDLHNDGIGNPKNVRSLLHAFERSPVMSMGVRADAAAAIRAGVKYILFTNLPPEFSAAIDSYVKSIAPVPSPRFIKGRLSPSAIRGKRIFEDSKTGCVTCHSPPLFTDGKQHAVGVGKFDRSDDRFYTPSLIEAWRTGPYLHDGSAATLREAITSANGHDSRGRTSHLSSAEIDDLVAYVESL